MRGVTFASPGTVGAEVCRLLAVPQENNALYLKGISKWTRKEYIASLEQGTRLLMEQNSNSAAPSRNAGIARSSCQQLCMEIDVAVRYIREKLHKPFFFGIS